MAFTINHAVAAVRPAPIAEAQAWIPREPSQRRFIDLNAREQRTSERVQRVKPKLAA